MLKCEICGKETDTYQVYCCNGLDCGCMGLPINESALCIDCEEIEIIGDENEQ